MASGAWLPGANRATRARTADRVGLPWIGDGQAASDAAIQARYRDRVPGGARPGWAVLRLAPGTALTQAVKHRRGRRLVRVDVRATIGALAAQPYPVHVERFNGVLRDRLNGLTRKTHAFAKDVTTWEAAFSLALFAHTWLRPHGALRQLLPAPANGRRYQPRTPAMAVGCSLDLLQPTTSRGRVARPRGRAYPCQRMRHPGLTFPKLLRLGQAPGDDRPSPHLVKEKREASTWRKVGSGGWGDPMLARMLLVEDEDAVAVTLPSILEAEGHPVDEILRHDGTIRILHGCGKVVVGDTRQMARRRGVTPALAEHGTAEATAESIRTRRLQLETIPVKPCQWAVLHLMAPSPERWHISAPGPDTEEPGWLS